MKSMSSKKYIGMTVNERLYAANLYDKFYEAVEKKNIDKVIAILKEVELTDASIDPILAGLGLCR